MPGLRPSIPSRKRLGPSEGVAAREILPLPSWLWLNRLSRRKSRRWPHARFGASFRRAAVDLVETNGSSKFVPGTFDLVTPTGDRIYSAPTTLCPADPSWNSDDIPLRSYDLRSSDVYEWVFLSDSDHSRVFIGPEGFIIFGAPGDWTSFRIPAPSACPPVYLGGPDVLYIDVSDRSVRSILDRDLGQLRKLRVDSGCWLPWAPQTALIVSSSGKSPLFWLINMGTSPPSVHFQGKWLPGPGRIVEIVPIPRFRDQVVTRYQQNRVIRVHLNRLEKNASVCTIYATPQDDLFLARPHEMSLSPEGTLLALHYDGRPQYQLFDVLTGLLHVIRQESNGILPDWREARRLPHTPSPDGTGDLPHTRQENLLLGPASLAFQLGD